MVRYLVRVNRQGYFDKDFDLDLCYIVYPNVISMSWPGDGYETLFRNPLKDVASFLNKYHKDHYLIFDLVMERNYDSSLFNDRVLRSRAMNDHSVCTISDMFEFAQLVALWVEFDSKNTAVIHCKGGKGRTGVMVCAYLLYSYRNTTTTEALQYFADMRTDNTYLTKKKKQGVETPSQLTYINYYYRLLKIIDLLMDSNSTYISNIKIDDIMIDTRNRGKSIKQFKPIHIVNSRKTTYNESNNNTGNNSLNDVKLKDNYGTFKNKKKYYEKLSDSDSDTSEDDDFDDMLSLPYGNDIPVTKSKSVNIKQINEIRLNNKLSLLKDLTYKSDKTNHFEKIVEIKDEITTPVNNIEEITVQDQSLRNLDIGTNESKSNKIENNISNNNEIKLSLIESSVSLEHSKGNSGSTSSNTYVRGSWETTNENLKDVLHLQNSLTLGSNSNNITKTLKLPKNSVKLVRMRSNVIDDSVSKLSHKRNPSKQDLKLRDNVVLIHSLSISKNDSFKKSKEGNNLLQEILELNNDYLSGNTNSNKTSNTHSAKISTTQYYSKSRNSFSKSYYENYEETNENNNENNIIPNAILELRNAIGLENDLLQKELYYAQLYLKQEIYLKLKSIKIGPFYEIDCKFSTKWKIDIRTKKDFYDFEDFNQNNLSLITFGKPLNVNQFNSINNKENKKYLIFKWNEKDAILLNGNIEFNIIRMRQEKNISYSSKSSISFNISNLSSNISENESLDESNIKYNNKLLGTFWCHSHFMSNNKKRLKLYKKDIDIMYKDKKNKKTPKDFMVEIHYSIYRNCKDC